MAHPKRRQSKTRTAKRRTHDKAVAPTLAICPNCGEWHVIVTTCTTYSVIYAIIPSTCFFRLPRFLWICKVQSTGKHDQSDGNARRHSSTIRTIFCQFCNGNARFSSSSTYNASAAQNSAQITLVWFSTES